MAASLERDANSSFDPTFSIAYRSLHSYIDRQAMKEKIVTAAHGQSQLQMSDQCVADYFKANRISNKERNGR
ncbi:hypothetical protein EVAR_51996_1 [Eumeta japonica]|uniref:Uncharacterized protein n=1 Tax=Eumeta variegata TaxID=151549 RepID=A0A4C1Y108_EUMVA|nr:hypothetical protein EVAR_51996_1 [Eumeta japonica]